MFLPGWPNDGDRCFSVYIGAVVEMGILSTLKRLLMEHARWGSTVVHSTLHVRSTALHAGGDATLCVVLQLVLE
jgi:hypothetical protein